MSHAVVVNTIFRQAVVQQSTVRAHVHSASRAQTHSRGESLLFDEIRRHFLCQSLNGEIDSVGSSVLHTLRHTVHIVDVNLSKNSQKIELKI